MEFTYSDLFVPHNQYQVWTGDTRKQGINTNVIDLVFPVNTSFIILNL